MDEILASIRPINPAAFGGLPQKSAAPQGNQQFDANQYLMQKIMQIRQRMNQGDLGALGNVMSAMPPPQQGAPAA